MPNGNSDMVLNYISEKNLSVPFILFTGRYDINWDLKYPLVGLVNDKNYKKLFKLIMQNMHKNIIK